MDSVPPVPQSEGGPVLAGRYELGPVLGRGGMGEVRAGWDRRLTRRVAVKVLRPDMAVHPEVRRRFEHEARMAAQLVHPSVVAVFDTGEDGEVAFLVMEQLSGRTLSERMAAGRLDAKEARVLGIQVLDALEAAHRIGLVHRDIKPGNILESGPGGWKVGDFGIAKSLEATDPALTSTGLVIGTPAYLAPERLAGGPATPASDLYAAGAVLYEALAGRRVLPAGAPLAAWAARPAPLDEVRPDLPPALVGLVTRAMDPDPARRFSSAGEMAEGLRERRLPGAAPDPGATVLLPPPTAVLGPVAAGPGAETTVAVGPFGSGPGDPGGAPTDVLGAGEVGGGPAGWVGASHRRRRSGWLAGAAALAVVVVVGLVAVIGSSSGSGTSGRGTGSTVTPGAGATTTTTPTTTTTTTTPAPTTTATSTSTTTTSTTTSTTKTPAPTAPPGPGGGPGHGKGHKGP